MQPNYTNEGVFHAERFSVFTEHNDDWVFEATSLDFSMVNAWWLCHLSQLAYFDKADALPIIEKMGLTLEAFVDDRQLEDSKNKLLRDTQAYILSTDDCVFLTFRGTEPDRYKDYLADAYLHPSDFLGKGKVHSGFIGALSGQCLEKIQETLGRNDLQNKPLWITGHSLGAALATIASCYFKPYGMYNFGSPRVGDKTFHASFNGQNNHRFVNCSDLVSHVPLKSPLNYQHVGTLHYFDADSEHSINPAPNLMRNDQLQAKLAYPFRELPLPFVTDKAFFRSIADHSIFNYQFGIWKALYR